MKLSHTFNIEHNGREFEVEVSAVLVHEADYGADADGNRGIAVDFIEDVSVESISAADENPISEEERKAIETLAEKKADEHAWEAPEPDYPDFDES